MKAAEAIELVQKLGPISAVLHVYDAQQARIDELMLEHCPDEMTQEQKDDWAAHQVVHQGD